MPRRCCCCSFRRCFRLKPDCSHSTPGAEESSDSSSSDRSLRDVLLKDIGAAGTGSRCERFPGTAPTFGATSGLVGVRAGGDDGSGADVVEAGAAAVAVAEDEAFEADDAVAEAGTGSAWERLTGAAGSAGDGISRAFAAPVLFAPERSVVAASRRVGSSASEPGFRLAERDLVARGVVDSASPAAVRMSGVER